MPTHQPTVCRTRKRLTRFIYLPTLDNISSTSVLIFVILCHPLQPLSVPITNYQVPYSTKLISTQAERFDFFLFYETQDQITWQKEY